ncbi:MAG: hypothetical protein VKS61_08165 [Candidatus Sericytochromatia bacterium]|nr:hypothetical protein [Candidatus Sericytochromatia bacterium]
MPSLSKFLLTLSCLAAVSSPAWAVGTKAKPTSTPTLVPEVALDALIKERQAIARPELTTLQVEEALRAFENTNMGRRVRLQGKVLDARELPGGYFVQVQLPHMTRPMWLRAHREAATAAKKGQPIVATALLRGLLGMALEPDLDDVRYPDLPPPGAGPSPSPSPKAR